MEIRDPIHGSIPLSSQEVAVIDTAEYQKLRTIKQLGFSEFSFPGGTHNRYIHSIGVAHLAGRAFDVIFDAYPFTSNDVRIRFRQCLRLGALLHDIGHGPLSHATEEVMPQLFKLCVGAYGLKKDEDRQATHEDYTIKYITDSFLTEVLRAEFPDLDPMYIACLIDRELECPDDFFIDNGMNFRPILSQIVSSELDVDRMDYLERDAFFCGTNYGHIEQNWLLSNLTYHQVENDLFLALNRRALYTFDDFLISRHHMHLMVYFHHKSIIYEEMLMRYLKSDDCKFFLPPEIEKYTLCTDYALYQHLAKQENPWAKAISQRRPYRVLIELHMLKEGGRIRKIKENLKEEGIHSIAASSKVRLSKYHSTLPTHQSDIIYVVDQYDHWSEPEPIEKCTQIFQKYEETRIISRLYVSPDNYDRAKNLLNKMSRT